MSKKIKRKSSKPTTPPKKDKSLLGPFQTLENLLAWSHSEMCDKRKDWICEKLYEWVQKEDSLTFISFCHEYSIPYDYFLVLAGREDKIKKVYNYAKTVIGMRREKLATFKEYGTNPAVILQTIRVYHPDFQETYAEDKKHEEASDPAARLLDFLEGKKLKLPDLDDKNRDVTSNDK